MGHPHDNPDQLQAATGNRKPNLGLKSERGSTIITSQVPIEHWHEVIADPTIADAVLDRLVHNAHRLTLKGDSMRKITAQRANLDATKKT
jgi:hypothetical protein